MNVLLFLESYYTLFFVWLSALMAGFVVAKNGQLNFRLFAGLIIVLAIVETIANIISFQKIKNHFLFNFSDSLLFFGAACFFYSNLLNKRIRKIILLFLIIFPVFFLLNNIFIQGFYTLNTNSYIFGGSLLLCLSVAYLWQLYVSDDNDSIFRDPVFWISIAYLFYCAISIPFLGMLNYLWNQSHSFTRLYYIRIYDISKIIYNILLTAGLLCMNLFSKQN